MLIAAVRSGPIHSHWRAQALSTSSKNYTLCDMFAFGLIVKWLLIGSVADIPFAGMPTDQIIRLHSGLHTSGGSVHPYVADLSQVPPVFRSLIRARAPLQFRVIPWFLL